MMLPSLTSGQWTDELLDQLRLEPKQVRTAGGKRTPRPRDELKHRRLDFSLQSESGLVYSVYTRQSVIIPDGFSCGLLVELPDGTHLHLARYNGSDHLHVNAIEQAQLPLGTHRHLATARYISAGKHPDGFAVEAPEYANLDGALQRLAADCNIEGLIAAYPSAGQLGLKIS